MRLNFLEQAAKKAKPNMDVVILTITCQRHQRLQLRLIKQVSVHHVQVVPVFQMMTLYAHTIMCALVLMA